MCYMQKNNIHFKELFHFNDFFPLANDKNTPATQSNENIIKTILALCIKPSILVESIGLLPTKRCTDKEAIAILNNMPVVRIVPIVADATP